MDKKLNDIKKELEACEKQKQEYLAGWQRAKADFVNYKKEGGERVQEFLKYATADFILKLLPVLDNLERAEKEIAEEQKDNETIRGFLRIKTQLEDFLKAEGVKRIETLGKKFDPSLHEVIEEVETEQESGNIIEEVQKGYLLESTVLRPSKVKVSKLSNSETPLDERSSI